MDDTSRKFWFKLKDSLIALKWKVMLGDEAFYYLHEYGELQGAVLTYVNNFVIAGNEDFIEMIRKGIADKLIILRWRRKFLDSLVGI